MKATLISKENNEAKLTMDFTGEELEQAIIAAYQKNKDKYTVDGFRKGKAPRSILEKKYGENLFLDDGINDLLNQEYPKALTELDLIVVDQPRVEFSQVKKGEDFTATVTVTVYPEVTVTDYKGVEIERVPDAITDEDVDQEMENMRKRNARQVSVDRPARKDDMVLIDYTGTMDGEEFDGGKAENFTLKLGSNTFIPGFEDQLIGVSKGEDKEVVVTFPEDYHAEHLAGKEARFACTVHEIKEEELPELDDEFAKDTSEFDTLEELRKDAEERLTKSKKAQAENKMKDAALGKVYEANELDIPDVMVDDEISQMMNEFGQQLQGQGLTLEKYIEMMGQDPGEFRNSLREDAYKRLKTRMLVGAIVEAEDVQATEEEVEKEMELMAIQYGMELDKVKEVLGPQNTNFMESDIKMKKAVDLIYDNAKIVEPAADARNNTEGKEE